MQHLTGPTQLQPMGASIMIHLLIALHAHLGVHHSPATLIWHWLATHKPVTPAPRRTVLPSDDPPPAQLPPGFVWLFPAPVAHS